MLLSLKASMSSFLTEASVSPGMVRRSKSTTHSFGTTLGWDPPLIFPTLKVGDPKSGCVLDLRSFGYSPNRNSKTGVIASIAFLPCCGVDPMSRFALCFQLEPQVSLVGGDDLQLRWVLPQSQISPWDLFGKHAGAGLTKLLVHQTDKQNFRFSGSAAFSGEFQKSSEKGGDRSFGIASSPSVHFSVLDPWGEILLGSRNDVQVRSQHDSMLGLAER